MHQQMRSACKRVQSWLKRKGYSVSIQEIHSFFSIISWAENPTKEEEINVREYLLAKCQSETSTDDVVGLKETLPIDVTSEVNNVNSTDSVNPVADSVIDPVEHLEDYQVRQIVDKKLSKAGIEVDIEELNDILESISETDKQTLEGIREAINHYLLTKYQFSKQEYTQLIAESKEKSHNCFTQFSEEIQEQFEQIRSRDNDFLSAFLIQWRQNNEQLIQSAKQNRERIEKLVMQTFLFTAIASPILFCIFTVFIFSTRYDTTEIKNQNDPATTNRLHIIPQ